MYHQKNNCVTIIVCYIITAGAFHTTAAFSRIPSRPADGDTTLYCSNSSAHMPDEWDAALYCGNGSAHMSDEGEAAPYYGDGSTRLTGGKVFTLKDCMEYALANSTDIRIQQADNDDRQTARRDAILAAFTPSISADAAAYSNFGRAVDPETNTYITTASFNNAWSVSAGITLFNGFQAVNNLRITKTAKAMGISQEQQIRDRICLATIEAYYNAVYYSKLTDIIASCVKTAEDVLRIAARQEELGQKSHSDVVQAKAELADREYQLTNARNSLTDAFITLKAIMFWPITEPLEIDCEEGMQDRMPCYAESLPDMSGPAGNRTAYLHGNRTVLTDGSKGDTTTGIIRNAIGFLPAASIAKGNMENARMELRTAKWRLAPSLSLYGGWSTNYYTYPGQKGYISTPYWNQLRENSGEYVQLTLSIPIFNRLSRQSDIARKRNAYRRASAEYEQTVREIEAEVMRAVSDRDGAMAALSQAERRSEVQEEAYHLNRKKFEQGLISAIEYQTASDSWLEARAEELNAMLQLRLKHHVVDYYNGIPYLMQE